MTVGVYPGSFDPFTVGHLDVLTSAAGLFDLVYVAVLHNVDKRPTFTVKERMEMIQNVLATEKLQNVHRKRPAGHVGFRVRVPDRRGEPPSGQLPPDRVFYGLSWPLLPELQQREGDRPLGRQHQGAGPRNK